MAGEKKVFGFDLTKILAGIWSTPSIFMQFKAGFFPSLVISIYLLQCNLQIAKIFLLLLYCLGFVLIFCWAKLVGCDYFFMTETAG